MARDLTRAYAARAAGRAPDWPPLPVQYADYSQWQIELLGSDADPDTLQAKQLDYWTSTLSGLPDVIDLPLDRPRPAERSMRGESVRFSVPADVHSDLLELARNHNATPFMVMHAVLAVLLARSERLAGHNDRHSGGRARRASPRRSGRDVRQHGRPANRR